MNKINMKIFSRLNNFIFCTRIFIILLVCCIGISILNLHYTETGNEEFQRNLEDQDDLLCLLKGPPKQDDPKLLKILRTKYIDSPTSKPYNLSSNLFYKRSSQSLSWPAIHRMIKKIFQSTNEKGFFVEAGALDGEYLSNTLWLEKELGWTGLLIESNPVSYAKLLSKNRKAWSSNTCISAKPYPYESTFVSVSEDKRSKRNSNSWIYKGASHLLGYTMSPNYKSIFEKSSKSFSTVQCFPLYSYLLALNRTEIDLLVLDIQGAEDDVISTIPFDKLKIKVFIVEHSTKNSFDASFKSYFEEKGFQLIQCYGEPDYIFVLRDEFIIPDHNITSCDLKLA